MGNHTVMTDKELAAEVRKELFNYPEFSPIQKNILDYVLLIRASHLDPTPERIATYFGYSFNSVVLAIKGINEHEVCGTWDLEKIYLAAKEKIDKKIALLLAEEGPEGDNLTYE